MEKITRSKAKELGLTHYYTGTKCKRGHVSKRLVSTCVCIDCNFLKRKEWIENNPEKHKKNSIKNYKNRDKKKKNQGVRDWRKNNKEHIRKYNEQYRKDNKELLLEYAKNYKKENRAYYTALQNKRRALKINSTKNHYTHIDVFDLLKKQNYKCGFCFVRLDTYHVDHIVPLSKGGSNDKDNIQILCVSCNQKKHNKDPIVFAQQNGRLL